MIWQLNNIRKIVTGQGDDYATGYLLDYPYFKKLIAIDLSKQQKLHPDPKATQQINFVGNLTRGGGARCISYLKKLKKQFSIFQKEQLKYYDFISF